MPTLIGSPVADFVGAAIVAVAAAAVVAVVLPELSSSELPQAARAPEAARTAPPATRFRTSDRTLSV
jgi:hypothetical protein